MKKQSQNKTIEAAALAEIAHTFRDGISITKGDLRDAELELQSVFISWPLKYEFVMKGGVKNQEIHIPNLIGKMPEVNAVHLDTTTNIQMEIASKPRIPKQALASVSPALVPIVKDRLLISAWRELRKQIQDKLKCLAGRKHGWTVLGIDSEDELIKTVRACYGVESSKQIRKTRLLPYWMTEQLLARKNRIESARTQSAKTKVKAKRKGRTKSVTAKSKTKAPRKIVKIRR